MKSRRESQGTDVPKKVTEQREDKEGVEKVPKP
jgi:hypothetical protein